MSDIAIDTVKRLQEDELKKIENDFVPEGESIRDDKWSYKRSLVEKIKPEWKQEDRNVLDQLKQAAEQTYVDIFEQSFNQLDILYSTVRVPVKNSSGKAGQDKQGRTIWDLDEWGRPKEDWSRLSSENIDATLIKLHELKFTVALRVKELFLETVFAKQSLQDDWHENFEKSIEGTTPQREARANRQTKDEKWRYFFNYYVWSVSDTFQQELNKTIDLLSRIRTWRS